MAPNSKIPKRSVSPSTEERRQTRRKAAIEKRERDEAEAEAMKAEDERRASIKTPAEKRKAREAQRKMERRHAIKAKGQKLREQKQEREAKAKQATSARRAAAAGRKTTAPTAKKGKRKDIIIDDDESEKAPSPPPAKQNEDDDAYFAIRDQAQAASDRVYEIIERLDGEIFALAVKHLGNARKRLNALVDEHGSKVIKDTTPKKEAKPTGVLKNSKGERNSPRRSRRSP